MCSLVFLGVTMPGPLRYYRNDPNKKRRGAGFYYHRGRGVYSKKDDSKDRKYKAKGFRGIPRKIGSGVYRHTHDKTGRKARLLGTKRPRTRRLPKKLPTYMNPRRRSRYYCNKCKHYHWTSSRIGRQHKIYSNRRK